MRAHRIPFWPVLGALLTLASAASGAMAADVPPPAYIGGKIVLVKTERVNGKVVQALTTYKGMTLYYDAQDTKGKPACTGSCTKTWKPYVLIGAGQPTGRADIAPYLSSVKLGQFQFQVEYKGHPLYTYVKDSRSGDARGAGKAPFHVATVATAAAGGNGSSSASSSSGASG